MNKLTERLAIGFTIISIWRVGSLISSAFNGGLVSWAFAILLAFSLYASGRGLRDPQTRLPAVLGLVVFGSIDLLLNEMDLVRVLSMNPVLNGGANFLGVPAAYLEYGLQIVAVLYGGTQTFGIFNLGWMAAGYERVKVTKPAQSKSKTAEKQRKTSATPDNAHAVEGAESNGEGKRRNELRAANRDRISALTQR